MIKMKEDMMQSCEIHCTAHRIGYMGLYTHTCCMKLVQSKIAAISLFKIREQSFSGDILLQTDIQRRISFHLKRDLQLLSKRHPFIIIHSATMYCAVSTSLYADTACKVMHYLSFRCIQFRIIVPPSLRRAIMAV